MLIGMPLARSYQDRRSDRWTTGELEFVLEMWIDLCAVVESALDRSTNIVSL